MGLWSQYTDPLLIHAYSNFAHSRISYSTFLTPKSLLGNLKENNGNLISVFGMEKESPSHVEVSLGGNETKFRDTAEHKLNSVNGF